MRTSLLLVASIAALLVGDVDLAVAGMVLQGGEDATPGTDLIFKFASRFGATATLNFQGDADALFENIGPALGSPDTKRCNGAGRSVFVVSNNPLVDFVSGLRSRIPQSEGSTLSASVRANGLVSASTDFVAGTVGGDANWPEVAGDIKQRVYVGLSGSTVGLVREAGLSESTTHRIDLGSVDAGWRTSEFLELVEVGPARTQRSEYQAQPIHSCIAK